MAQPIRILHIIDKFSMDGVNPSSCTRLFAEWIPTHDPDRFHIEVAGLRPPDPAGKFLQEKGAKVHYIARGKFSLQNVTEIENLARAGRFDILHLHGYSSANFGRMAAARLRIPAIVHEHAILKVQPHQFVADWLLRHKTTVGVAVAEAVKAFMIEGRSIPAEKIRVIWNGINVESFRPPAPDRIQAFRKQFGISENQKLIGTVTRLREEKGNRYFIEAAARIGREMPDCRFMIVGDGPLMDTLKNQADGLGLNGNVHFTGFLDDVPLALGAIDIAVMPSLTEGFPVALAEAMAAGKPVVVTRVGGMQEMVQHEENGLLVPSKNSPALAQALAKLLQNSAFRRQLGEKARQRSADFSVEKNVRALETLYEDITQEGALAAR